METYKLKLIFMFILTSILNIRCIYNPNYDVYAKIPKSSRLTKEILLNSTQIIIYESDIILAYNTCPNCWNHNDTHLLFYDKNLTLSAASFFSGGQVQNIENGVIKGYLNESRAERSSWYRNDLPPKYSLNIRTSAAMPGSYLPPFETKMISACTMS